MHENRSFSRHHRGISRASTVIRSSEGRQAHTRVAGTAKSRNLGSPRSVIHPGGTWPHRLPRGRTRCSVRVESIRITDLFPNSLLLNKRKHGDQERSMTIDRDRIVEDCPWPLAARVFVSIPMDGQVLVGRMVVVDPQANLLEVVAAAHAASRFSSCLNCWQKEADQDADDRDDHQQLDQRKTSSAGDMFSFQTSHSVIKELGNLRRATRQSSRSPAPESR